MDGPRRTLPVGGDAVAMEVQSSVSCVRFFVDCRVFWDVWCQIFKQYQFPRLVHVHSVSNLSVTSQLLDSSDGGMVRHGRVGMKSSANFQVVFIFIGNAQHQPLLRYLPGVKGSLAAGINVVVLC